jgi:YggT family protein
MTLFFVIRFVSLLFEVLILAIVGRAVLSWFAIRPGNPFYPIVVVLHQITEPILAPLRRVIPRFGMLDLTPLIALILLQFMQAVVISALRQIAAA